MGALLAYLRRRSIVCHLESNKLKQNGITLKAPHVIIGVQRIPHPPHDIIKRLKRDTLVANVRLTYQCIVEL